MLVTQGAATVYQPRTREEAVESDKIDKLQSRSERVLFHTKAVWPFDLFPNEIVIDENKVNFIFKRFWGTEQIRSIDIAQISEVIMHSDPFFASLKIIDKSYADNIIVIKFLKIQDAIRARRIVQGLVLCKRDENVDFSKLSPDEILAKAEEVGRARLGE